MVNRHPERDRDLEKGTETQGNRDLVGCREPEKGTETHRGGRTSAGGVGAEMRVRRDRGTEQEEGTELGYGGRKEQKCRERIGVEGGKDDWEINGGREKKGGTEGTRYTGVATQAPPAYAAHTPPGTGRRRRPGRSAGSLFQWSGRARRSARIQH